MDKSPEEIIQQHFDNTVSKLNAENDMEKQRLGNELNQKLSQVTPELFAEFLEGKGASHACLSCGSNNLSVPETRIIDNSNLPEGFEKLQSSEQIDAIRCVTKRYVTYSFIENEMMPRLGNVQYRVNCLNCGYVSFYRAYPAVQWVLASGAESEE
ncbi:TPA: hypothetical protein PXP22_001024 [Yersinia enterocolitica]|nr:hypothetical protein [Yersinia enterocolitica]HDL7686470.1 hypothetical protein [Yersinia enterocolitica]HDL7790315.1 hypothetical protein [Yersinia enterocolitica]HDL8194172.1 hypothetical protein [Yersinia enterocolitica]